MSILLKIYIMLTKLVYIRAMPDGSLTFRSKNLVGSKKAMARVTVLCCANMTDKHMMNSQLYENLRNEDALNES